jgi:hypothetical protein
MTEYIARDIAPAVLAALENMPVVALTGMRQTGKTTFLKSQPELAERIFVSLDDFAQLEAAKSDPDGFIHRNAPMTIDEAQKCPELFVAIKRAVDKRREPGRFLLSGSANFSVLKIISESLAGRSVYLSLHPLTRRELERNTNREPFIKTFFEEPNPGSGSKFKIVRPEEIAIGGMPTVGLGHIKEPGIWFRGYEQTYLERDVRELSQVGNLLALRTLLHLSSLRTGQVLSLSQIGRDAKLNVVTTSRYIALFEASFLIQRVFPFLSNRSSRLIKSPKLFFSDTGLVCHLMGMGISAAIQSDPLFGAFFETYVAQNLRSILDSRWTRAELYYWSIQGRHEVDFIIASGRSCIALEVKAAVRWHEKDLSGLQAFLNATPNCKAAVLCYNGEEAVRLGEKLWVLPASLVLS